MAGGLGSIQKRVHCRDCGRVASAQGPKHRDDHGRVVQQPREACACGHRYDRKDRVSYYARVHIDGIPETHLAPTLGEAQDWLRQQRERKVKIEAGVERRRPVTGTHPGVQYKTLIAELLPTLKARGDVRSQATERGYRTALRAISARLDERRVIEMTKEAWDAELAWMARPRCASCRAVLDLELPDTCPDCGADTEEAAGLAPQTIRNRADLIAQLHQLAVDRGYLAALPCTVTRPRPAAARPRRPATEGEVCAALERSGDPRVRCALLLAADAGLRIHEIPRLDGRQVDLDANWIREVSGKGGTFRAVPIRSKRLALALAALAPANGVPLLGQELRSESGLRHALVRDLNELYPGMHRCRHLCATRWVNDPEISLGEARRWLGHRRSATTDGYTREAGDASLGEGPERIRIPLGYEERAAARLAVAAPPGKPRQS